MKKIFIIAVMVLLLSGTGNAKRLHVKANTGSNGPFDATAEWTVNGERVGCAEDSTTYSISPDTEVDLDCTSDEITDSSLSGTIAFSPIGPVICNAIIAFSYNGEIKLADMWETDNTYNSISYLTTSEYIKEEEFRKDSLFLAVEDDGKAHTRLKVDIGDGIDGKDALWRVREVEWQYISGYFLNFNRKNTVAEGDFSEGNEVDVEFTPTSSSHIDLFSLITFSPKVIQFIHTNSYCVEVGIDLDGDGRLNDNEVMGDWEVLRDRDNPMAMRLHRSNIYMLYAYNEEDISDVRGRIGSLIWLGDAMGWELVAYNMDRFLNFQSQGVEEYDIDAPTVSSMTIAHNHGQLQYPAGADFSKSDNVDRVTHSATSNVAAMVYESESLKLAINKILREHNLDVTNHFKSHSSDYSFSATLDGLDFRNEGDANLWYALGVTEGTIKIDVVVKRDGSTMVIDSIKVQGRLEDLYDWIPMDVGFPIQLQWNPGKGKYGRIYYNVVELDHEFTEWESYTYEWIMLSNFRAADVCPIA